MTKNPLEKVLQNYIFFLAKLHFLSNLYISSNFSSLLTIVYTVLSN